MKSRLKKVALMSPDMFENQINQIGQKGRSILKEIEEYKFFIEQVSRVVKNDPGLTQMIMNKKKNIDQAAQQIYDAVFEIENIDITSLYERHEDATNPQLEIDNEDETVEKEDSSEDSKPQEDTKEEPKDKSEEDPKEQEKPEEKQPEKPEKPQNPQDKK